MELKPIIRAEGITFGYKVYPFPEHGLWVADRSWFFAKSCPRTDEIFVVWPEDGAYASPLHLLVKASRMKEMTAITDYVTGYEWGTGAFCPVSHRLIPM